MAVDVILGEPGLQRQDPLTLVYHGAPIWRDGQMVGHVTSGTYGQMPGTAVALGQVDTRWTRPMRRLADRDRRAALCRLFQPPAFP